MNSKLIPRHFNGYDQKTSYSKFLFQSLLQSQKLHLFSPFSSSSCSSEGEMSYLLPHLHSGWAVDQAILAEEERLVVIRFGHDWDETCMQMDEVLASVAETIKNFAVIFLVDITEVPDFNTMYELYDPSTVMFFFRNKHIMIDLGTGNNNKINWALKDKQEFIDIVETVYRGSRKGRGLVIAPKDYSTKYRY
ncbi:putative Dim1 family, Thioredoxin-like superfamily [Dioscorea sansibarensis]